MLKFAARTAEKSQLIGLGFSEANFLLLKENKPIIFKFSDLNVDWPGNVLIIHAPDSVETLPKFPGITICLRDATMDFMRKSRTIKIPFINKDSFDEQGEFFLFWANSEQELLDIVEKMKTAGLMTEKTRYKREGI